MMFVSALLSGCAGSQPPLATVDYVDLDRFMGDWYVIANIPTFVEKGAYNAVETYEMDPDGSIKTTFVFRKDGFDGERKEHNPTGFVKNTETNAEWGMQFIWPIKADYRIIYLDEDYELTVIGRSKRDYVWVMSRKPELSDEEFSRIQDFIGSVGYDKTRLQRVPQQPARNSI
jgi:apolipoprotein D and lipocalin family protein